MTRLRELLGLALLALGLYFFFTAVDAVRRERLLDGGLIVLIGVVVFNAGLHLLKVAAAVRILSRREPKPGEPGPDPGKPREP